MPSFNTRMLASSSFKHSMLQSAKVFIPSSERSSNQIISPQPVLPDLALPASMSYKN